ncbi:TetR/AcrR family transcriptional regulator [Flavobacteriaceae bacterium F08102]|nr:TetR/AcrR family transcriptional regulator [Flavobacteriaceae bacterium F08102]
MARKKKYNEDEVIEKAMHLFWRNGYAATSMQMLEKEMGINKFSIYASFGNKHGLFLKSIQCYKKQLNSIFEAFKNSNKGIEDIKDFFYNSVRICQIEGNQKGCLLTNTYNEFSGIEDKQINELMNSFMKDLKELFIQKLRMNSKKDEETIVKQANYLLLAKHGLAAASRVNNEKEIEDYIEMTFKNL